MGCPNEKAPFRGPVVSLAGVELQPGDLEELLENPRLPTMWGARLGYYSLAALGSLGALALWGAAFWVHWLLGLLVSPLLILLVTGPFTLVQSRLSQLQRLRSLQRIS